MPEAIAKRLLADFGLTAIVATEIEFYLHGARAKFTPEQLISRIEMSCADAGLKLACAEAECGPDQYEISLLPTDDIGQLIADTERFKSLIAEVFAPHGINADFAAKPILDAPGSGLHVHVHLEDAAGKNILYREDDTFSPGLLYAIGGLLALMNGSMRIFAPTAESYRRFTHTVNKYLVCPTASNVPSTVSWSTNNRTVAIRLPSKPAHNKHIEHRVAGSDANVADVIAAILIGIHYGLTHKCDPGPPIYGDASLPQYALPKLAIDSSDIMQYNEEHKILEAYFSNFSLLQEMTK